MGTDSAPLSVNFFLYRESTFCARNKIVQFCVNNTERTIKNPHVINHMINYMYVCTYGSITRDLDS